MDLHVRVANLERANRRWKLLFAIVIGIWPILLFAGGMNSKITDEEIADEIRARTLVIVDNKGNVFGSFDANGLTMQQGDHVAKVRPSDIHIASHQKSSVRITGNFIRLCGFDVEKKQRFEELREQGLRDGLTKEESRKIGIEMGKNYYEPALVSIFPNGQGKGGVIQLSDVQRRHNKYISPGN